MQNMVHFYHNKGNGMLMFGCFLPHFAKVCLHKTPTAKFDLFTENDTDLLEKVREDMVGLPSIVKTSEVVVNKTFNCDATNWFKSFVGIDAGELYPFFMCQAMPTGLYKKSELDSESGKIRPPQNKTRSFENVVKS